jgi:hypothetical protein
MSCEVYLVLAALTDAAVILALTGWTVAAAVTVARRLHP